jgi:hypothetical protein
MLKRFPFSRVIYSILRMTQRSYNKKNENDITLFPSSPLLLTTSNFKYLTSLMTLGYGI